MTPLDAENPLKDCIKHILLGINKWRNENTPEKIQKNVIDQLENSRKEIVFKLLGFNTTYGPGTWELDHCNGRAGDSAAGDYLRNVQADAIKKWLSYVKIPELTNKDIKKLEKEMYDVYLDYLTQALYKQSEQLANQNASIMMKKLVNTGNVDNLLKTLSLINIDLSSAPHDTQQTI